MNESIIVSAPFPTSMLPSADKIGKIKTVCWCKNAVACNARIGGDGTMIQAGETVHPSSAFEYKERQAKPDQFLLGENEIDPFNGQMEQESGGESQGHACQPGASHINDHDIGSFSSASYDSSA